MAQVQKHAGGRPPGSLGQRTKALRAVADQALVSGLSPLEVMLENMRFWHQKVEVLQTAIVKDIGKKPPLELLKALKDLGSFRERSESCAVDAAPYVHVRLNATSISGEITHKVEEAEAAFKTIEHALNTAVYGEIIPAREKAKA